MIHLAPAGAGDVVGLLAAQERLTVGRRTYGALLAQVSQSEAWAVRPFDGGSVLCIGGIAPLGLGAGEIWFGVRRGGLGRWLLPVVRRTREVLASRAPDYPGGLMCLVEPGHRPGERLAAAIGCAPANALFMGAREWRWVDELCREDVQTAASRPERLRAADRQPERAHRRAVAAAADASRDGGGGVVAG